MRQRVLGTIVVTLISGAAAAEEPGKVDFAKDVQPLLRQHCVSCHGPSQQLSGLRLDRRRDAMRGGTMRPVLTPGSAEHSRLYLKIAGDQIGPQMPPTGALAPEEIDTIKTWIDQGAEWPDEVSGDEEFAPADPRAVRLMKALRANDRAALRRALIDNPKAATLKGENGTTPLMYAALYSTPAAMQLLIACGADPNAKNDAGATALMWAVGDVEKTRILLNRNADVNAKSGDGRTPVMIAAGRYGSSPVLELLLERGAKPNVKALGLFGEVTPLSEAAYAGDVQAMELLLKNGADPGFAGFLPAGFGVQSGCKKCVDLVAKSIDRETLSKALMFAVPPFGDGSRVAWLMEHGADPALAQRGMPAPKKAELPYKDQPAPMPSHAPSPRAAVEKSLPILQRTGGVFLEKSGCISCHNNTLTSMTLAAARASAVAVDEEAAQAQLARIAAVLGGWRERALQGVGIPGDADTVSYVLHGLAAEQYPPDVTTDAMARYLKNRQMADGRWRILGQRPPIESSDVEVTALSMRALQVYAPAALRAEFDASVSRATAWLASAAANSNEDRAFRVLGLAWGRAEQDVVMKAVRDLLAAQQPDGGWAQLPSMTSDAYATGQALVALHESGIVSVTDAAYRRGVRFLLDSQYADGTWHVKTRAIPIQPLIDIGFPHGRDSWISAAATNWAATALAIAARPPDTFAGKE